jgi:hypothetical protein
VRLLKLVFREYDLVWGASPWRNDARSAQKKADLRVAAAEVNVHLSIYKPKKILDKS